MTPIEVFVDQVSEYRSPGVFNPWGQVDPFYDLPDADQIRRSNLIRYFSARMESARYILVAEAAGFRGAKFSGMAMTSERALMNDPPLDTCSPFFDGDKKRSSNAKAEGIPVIGMIEPTASIVWKNMLRLLDGRDWINWNTFAWHPYKDSGAGLHSDRMTNRTPTDKEVAVGEEVLKAFLTLFPDRQLICVGNISEATLGRLGYPAKKVRHPANGGATLFAEQVAKIIRG